MIPFLLLLRDNMKMNPIRFLALSLMALTITSTASGQVRGTKKTTSRPTATTAGSPTRVSSHGRLIRWVSFSFSQSSLLAHVVAHSRVCFFFLFDVKTPLRHPRLCHLPSRVLLVLPVPPNLTISTQMSLLENHALGVARGNIVR